MNQHNYRYTGQNLQLPETRFIPVYSQAVRCDLLFCWGQLQNPQIQLAADTVKAEELIDRAT